MRCPECKANNDKVVDSRPRPGHVYRRRFCLSCGCRFSTYELIVQPKRCKYLNAPAIRDFERIIHAALLPLIQGVK
jgi:Predicted transcriptional regulator, consists of a Zn-ribbon and ATP-cone domains